MSLVEFGTFPAGIPGNPVPFSFHVPGNDIDILRSLVRTAQVATPSWYTSHANAANGTFGISRDWLITAQETWAAEDGFSWPAQEEHFNRFPNFKINITTPSDGQLFELHFAALLSKNQSAVPITFLHGWPGSWLEFVPMLDLLVAKYTPETLPYHVIVPSIPDYGLSRRPSEDRELTMEAAAEAMNELMVALGFDGYVAQGGDVGSFLAQTMCGVYEQCMAFHLNMYFMSPEQMATAANISITPEEQARLEAAAAWAQTGSAYAYEHSTRPSTISLVLGSNPLAMLAWVGEKFIEWSDNRDPFSLDTILLMTSFYWFSGSFGRAMWSYRALSSAVGGPPKPMPISMTKPFGFSAFPIEIAVLPQSWAKHLFPNLVFYKTHERGGHFAALQEPERMLHDIEEFVSAVGHNIDLL